MSAFVHPGDGSDYRATVLSLPESDLATPYESWCETVGVHPESVGAWDHYSSLLHLRESA